MVVAAAVLSACGSAAPTPAATRGAVPPTPTMTSTPSATPTPTPLPPPPLAIIRTDTSVYAVDASGHVQWTLNQAAINNLLNATATDRILARTAGPNVILLRIPGQPQNDGNLVVLDRTGTKIGGGSFIPNDSAGHVFGNPTGTEWAWSVDDAPAAATRQHGRIIVAGIGVPAHTVFSWVAPVGAYTEWVADWTDMGIVMERLNAGGCGAGFHPDSASFLVDPAAGTLTDLFTNGDHYGDARHNVSVGFAAQSQSAVTVNGTTFDEAKTVANGVYVSPDGARVGVQRFSLAGCAGVTPTLGTEIVDVSGGNHSDVAGCGIVGWFDATHFVCHAFSDQTQRLETVDGQPGASLGAGEFIGAVPGV
jgi:hypothetical protein